MVQSAHATLEVGRSKLISKNQVHPSLVICGLPNESSINEFKSKLEKAEINYREFAEPDLNNSLTALATEAISGEKRKIFANLPLIKSIDLKEGKDESK